MRKTNHKIVQRLSWGARFRYALSDLRNRLVTAAIPVVATAIGTGTFLLLSFYGYQFYRYQQDLVSGETLSHITAMCEDIGDRKTRFTEDRLTELGGREDIATIYPKLEQGVSLTAGVAGQIQIPAEGILPSDPRIISEKLEWASPIARSDSAWIYVSSQVFQKLGGIVRVGEPSPPSLTLKVARTKNGRDEQLVLPVAIKGILRRQMTDRVFIPQEMAQQLDKYTSHKIDALGEGENSPNTKEEYEFAYAYVRPEYASRLESDAQYLNIQMVHSGNVEVLLADNRPIWGLIQGDTEKAILASAVEGIAASVPGTKSYPEFTAGLPSREGIVNVVALSKDDPRWDLVSGGIPARGRLVAKESKYRGLTLGNDPVEAHVADICESFPVAGDLICSLETLAWLQFRPADSDQIAHETLLLTDSALEARFWAASGLDVCCEDPTAWSIFELKPQSATATAMKSEMMYAPLQESDMMDINQRLADSTIASPDTGRGMRGSELLHTAAPAQAGIMENAELNAEYGFLGRGKAILHARVIPDGFFSSLVGEDISGITYDNRIPCIQTGRLPADIEGKELSVNGRRLKIFLSDAIRDIGPYPFWIPKSATAGLPRSRYGDAAAVWGRWDHVLGAGRRLADAGAIGQTLYRDGPTQFWSVTQESDRELVDPLMTTGKPLRYAVLWTASGKSGRIATVVEQNGLSVTHLKALLDSEQNVALMDRRTFCQEVFDANKGGFPSDTFRRPRFSISIPSPLGFQQVSRAVEESGYYLHQLTPIRAEAWERYLVTDMASKDGHVADDLLGVISMNIPTFAAAEPYLRVSGSIDKTGLPLMGTTASDPFQFAANVREGGWISSGSKSEIVLPVSMAPAATESGSLIGQFVQVKFQREDPVTHRAEDLAMAMQVVGLTDGSAGYIPIGLARDLDRWALNECMFNVTKGRFETPMETYERRGYIRANIIAADAESVESLVNWLETHGYRTESSLGSIAGLKQLRGSLVIVVCLFSIGTLLTAASTVLVTALMNVNSKAWEIGLLKALGVGDREIITIFLIQGVIISVAGFIGAALFSGLIEPLLFRKWLTAIFGNGISDVISGTVLSLHNWFLPGIAFAVSIAFSLLGMSIPALKACRVVPVKALNNRE